MMKLLLSFFSGVLVCFISLYAYMENNMNGEVIEAQESLAESYQVIFAPFQAHDLATLDKQLTALVEEDYCAAKQILAVKILGILAITDLKESYGLSEEKLDEIRSLAEEYDPFDSGASFGVCD